MASGKPRTAREPACGRRSLSSTVVIGEESCETHFANVDLEHASCHVIGGLSEVVPDEGVGVLLGDEEEDDREMSIRDGAHCEEHRKVKTRQELPRSTAKAPANTQQ